MTVHEGEDRGQEVNCIVQHYNMKKRETRSRTVFNTVEKPLLPVVLLALQQNLIDWGIYTSIIMYQGIGNVSRATRNGKTCNVVLLSSKLFSLFLAH